MRLSKVQFWIVGLLSMTTLGSAMATPDALFGNTLQITSPNGNVVNMYLNADGSYSATFSSGLSVTGTWQETVGQLCITQAAPISMPAACGPDITQSVGDTWTMNNPDGSTAQVAIVAGR